MLQGLYLLFCFLLIGPANAQYAVQQVYQFPNKNFVDVENIAVRSNGQLLLNLITAPSTYYLDPLASNQTAKLLYTFPNATTLTGIAEVSPDVFAVVAGNYTVATKAGVLGSFAVWTIDVRSPAAPVVKKVAAIPQAKALNGMTAVKGSPGLVLIADSGLGVVWSLNVTSGLYKVGVSDPLLGPTKTFPLGINGLHVYNGVLFFTNSAQGLFGSVGITSEGLARGNASIVAYPSTGNIYDDFAIDKYGRSWITNHPNAITQVNLGGVQTNITGGAQFVQPTSAAFGRGSVTEECTLYVVTAGTFKNITSITSGQVLKLSVCEAE